MISGIDEIRQILMEMPGIKGVEAWGGAAAEIWGKDSKMVTRLSIAAPHLNTRLLSLDFVAGRWLLPGEKQSIVISDTIYNFYPHLKPGDIITVKLPGRQKEEWKVAGIFPYIHMMGDPTAYGNFDFISSETRLSNQASSYHIITENHTAASQLELTQTIESHLLNQNYKVESVEAGSIQRGKAINAIMLWLFSC